MPFCVLNGKSRANQGFTLVEILAALAIFSIISLASFRLLNTTATFVATTSDHQALRLEKERALAILVNDLRHAVALPLVAPDKAPIGSKLNPELVMEGRSVEFQLIFNRSNYYVMRDELSSMAVKLHYELRPIKGASKQNSGQEFGANELVRTVTLPSSEQGEERVRTQVLLQGVRSVSIRFLNDNNEWANSWPQRQQAVSNREGDANSLDSKVARANLSLPKAVELLLDLDGEQQLRKLVGLRS